MTKTPDTPKPSLFHLLLSLYTPEEALMWLTTPQKMLDGHSPEHFLRLGRYDEVLTVVKRITEGAYV